MHILRNYFTFIFSNCRITLSCSLVLWFFFKVIRKPNTSKFKKTWKPYNRRNPRCAERNKQTKDEFLKTKRNPRCTEENKHFLFVLKIKTSYWRLLCEDDEYDVYLMLNILLLGSVGWNGSLDKLSCCIKLIFTLKIIYGMFLVSEVQSTKL